MKELNELVVSYGNSVKNNKVVSKNITEIISSIRSNSELKEKIEVVRSISDKKERTDKKVELLPYFICATFSDDRRLRENFISTDMMILDYDALGEDYNVIKDKIRSDDEVFISFQSPSGDGIKVIYLFEHPITSLDKYCAVFNHFKRIKDNDYGVVADISGKDVTRTCFLSHDPEVLLNRSAKTLEVDNITQVPQRLPVANQISFKKVKEKELQYLPSAVEFLRENISDRDTWITCGFALASLGEMGRGYFHLLSKNPRYQYDDVQTVDTQFDNLLRTQSGTISISTLFYKAQELGFNYPDLDLKEFSESASSSIPKKPLGELLREKFEFDDVRDPNKPLGYSLDKFKELSKNIDGLQTGLYIVGADSNVGKTAFLTNICLDLINSNPDVTVVYLSLDDSKYYTVYRFLSILTQFHINDVRKKCTDPNKQNTLLAKRQFFIDLVESGRLTIIDQSDISRLDQIEDLLIEAGITKKLVVFIDGLYNLEVDSSSQGIRVENIERANSLKAIVDKYLIPVIATGELRKKGREDGINKKPSFHDLMETGRFAYNANVVWLLYGKAIDLITDEPIITLEFSKNKLSDFRGKQEIKFKRATGTMQEFNLISPISTVPSATGLFQGGDID